jgi:hypothetical protein
MTQKKRTKTTFKNFVPTAPFNNLTNDLSLQQHQSPTA